MKLAVYTQWRFGWMNAGESLRITFVYDAAKKFSRVNITRQLAEKFRHDAFTLTPKGFAHDRLGLLNRVELAVVDSGENFQRLPRWLNVSALCRQFLAFCSCLDEAIRWSSAVEQRAQGVSRAEARLDRSFAFCFAPDIGITFHFLDEHLSIQLDRYHSAQLNVAACERALAIVNYSAPALYCVRTDSSPQDCFCFACVVRLLIDSERARVWIFACLTLYLNWRDFARANISDEHKTAYDAVYSIADLFSSQLLLYCLTRLIKNISCEDRLLPKRFATAWFARVNTVKGLSIARRSLDTSLFFEEKRTAEVLECA